MIFTFWEGYMPDYIRLCMETWKHEYTVLNYDNLSNYTDLQITPELLRFTYPQIADCVRVHVLRDQGGCWLDCDTIMITGKMPDTNMIGDPVERTQTIGYLRSEAHSPMYEEWAAYQDGVIRNPYASHGWSVMGNDFTDLYVRQHKDITICSVDKCWPEVYMIKDTVPRHEKYQKFYFENDYHMTDIRPTDMLMLHNSWTPSWYKDMCFEDILKRRCTLSNILNEVMK